MPEFIFCILEYPGEELVPGAQLKVIDIDLDRTKLYEKFKHSSFHNQLFMGVISNISGFHHLVGVVDRKKVSADGRSDIKALYLGGERIADISRKYGVSRFTVRSYLAEMGFVEFRKAGKKK